MLSFGKRRRQRPPPQARTTKCTLTSPASFSSATTASSLSFSPTSPLSIAASYSASGDYCQVSRDIARHIEKASIRPDLTLSSLEQQSQIGSLTKPSSKRKTKRKKARKKSIQSTKDPASKKTNEGSRCIGEAITDKVIIEEAKEERKEDEFPPDVRLRQKLDSNTTINNDDTAFGQVQLVSPAFFRRLEQNQKQQKQQAKKHEVDDAADAASVGSRSLASMVHSIDLTLFHDDLDSYSVQSRQSRRNRRLQENNDDESVASDTSSLSSCSVYSANSSVCSYKSTSSITTSKSTSTKNSAASSSTAKSRRVIIQDALFATAASKRSKLASCFHSTGRDRVAYRLQSGRKGMTTEDKQKLLQVTSSSSVVLNVNSEGTQATTTNATSSKDRTYPTMLYVLLLEPVHKLFEVVRVDFHRDLTVGDVLSKVRAQATDAALAKSVYKSLLRASSSSGMELAAPMLPVRHLLRKTSSISKNLLTAVPEGATAAQCRNITHYLMQNPKVQRWLSHTDPFAVQSSGSSVSSSSTRGTRASSRKENIGSQTNSSS